MPTRKRAITGTPNRDPITDAPGAHPLGVGVGTAAGGAAAGAAAGMAVGPVGAVVGAIAGGLLGGLAGKAVAEDVEPTVEEAYWREHFASRPYVEPGSDYARYEVAYRYGWEARAGHEGVSFADVEAELAAGWKN